MSPTVITLIFLAFAIIMFVTEKIPLGLTSMIVCIGLVITGVLSVSDAFNGFINSNVILFVAMFIVGGALFETGMANEIGSLVTKFAKTEPKGDDKLRARLDKALDEIRADGTYDKIYAKWFGGNK